MVVLGEILSIEIGKVRDEDITEIEKMRGEFKQFKKYNNWEMLDDFAGNILGAMKEVNDRVALYTELLEVLEANYKLEFNVAKLVRSGKTADNAQDTYARTDEIYLKARSEYNQIVGVLKYYENVKEEFTAAHYLAKCIADRKFEREQKLKTLKEEDDVRS